MFKSLCNYLCGCFIPKDYETINHPSIKIRRTTFTSTYLTPVTGSIKDHFCST